jgi:transposase-like protein
MRCPTCMSFNLAPVNWDYTEIYDEYDEEYEPHYKCQECGEVNQHSYLLFEDGDDDYDEDGDD